VLLHGLRRFDRGLLRLPRLLGLLLGLLLNRLGLLLALCLLPLALLLAGPLGLAVVRDLEIDLDRIELLGLPRLLGLRFENGRPARRAPRRREDAQTATRSTRA